MIIALAPMLNKNAIFEAVFLSLIKPENSQAPISINTSNNLLKYVSGIENMAQINKGASIRDVVILCISTLSPYEHQAYLWHCQVQTCQNQTKV